MLAEILSCTARAICKSGLPGIHIDSHQSRPAKSGLYFAGRSEQISFKHCAGIRAPPQGTSQVLLCMTGPSKPACFARSFSAVRKGSYHRVLRQPSSYLQGEVLCAPGPEVTAVNEFGVVSAFEAAGLLYRVVGHVDEVAFVEGNPGVGGNGKQAAPW